jgi:hypothetical protein
MNDSLPNLLDFTLEDMEAFIASSGRKNFAPVKS